MTVTLVAGPTPSPTPSPTQAVQASGASAVGDPHLQNVHGERFDLMMPGRHVLIDIPRGGRAENAVLRVVAEARQLGGSCADIYFQQLNITGHWAEAKQAGGYHFDSHEGVEESPEWLIVGKVGVKVAHGRTQDGIVYLNFYVKHLGRTGFVVGGLLGEDDYGDVIKPPAGCAKKLALRAAMPSSSFSSYSVAIADMA
jgi:hypothetical protein